MNGAYGLIPFIITLIKGNTTQVQISGNNEIISRLKFISKIKTGEKINVRCLTVQPDDISTSFSRTFYNKDNRQNTLAFIQNTVERSFELINYYHKSEKLSDQLLRNCIIDDLQSSKTGIQNLRETYSHDVKFGCDLDTIVQHIDAILSEVSKEETEIRN